MDITDYLFSSSYNEEISAVRAEYGTEVGERPPEEAGEAVLFGQEKRLGVIIAEEENQYVLHVANQGNDIEFQNVKKDNAVRADEQIAEQLAARSEYYIP